MFVILLFFGAKSIPKIARTLGRAMREVRDATGEIQREIRDSADDVRSDLGNMNVRKQIEDNFKDTDQQI